MRAVACRSLLAYRSCCCCCVTWTKTRSWLYPSHTKPNFWHWPQAGRFISHWQWGEVISKSPTCNADGGTYSSFPADTASTAALGSSFDANHVGGDGCTASHSAAPGQISSCADAAPLQHGWWTVGLGNRNGFYLNLGCRAQTQQAPTLGGKRGGAGRRIRKHAHMGRSRSVPGKWVTKKEVHTTRSYKIFQHHQKLSRALDQDFYGKYTQKTTLRPLTSFLPAQSYSSRSLGFHQPNY